MTRTARGISEHFIVQAMEEAGGRLERAGLSRLQANRCGAIITMMLSDPRCSKQEAIAAADRLFPITGKGKVAN